MQGVNNYKATNNSKFIQEVSNMPNDKISGLELFRTICASCEKKGEKTKLSRCSHCKIVYYCNATCQKADWISHKLYCQKFENVNPHLLKSPVELWELFEIAKTETLKGHWAQAREKLNLCLSQTHEKILRLEVHSFLGQCLFALGESTNQSALRELSHKHFEAGIQIAGSCERSLLVKGFCLTWLKKHTEGLQLADRVLESNSASIQAYVLKMQIYKNMKEYSKAHEMRLKIADLETKTHQENIFVHESDKEAVKTVLLKNGFFDLNIGQYEEALAEFNELLTMVPEHAEALFGLGACLIALDRKEEGRSKLLKVLELDPDHYKVKELLDHLNH